MALTIEFLSGLESGNFEAQWGTQGSPEIVTSPKRTGDYALGGSGCITGLAQETGGNGILFGAAYYFSSITGSTVLAGFLDSSQSFNNCTLYRDGATLRIMDGTGAYVLTTGSILSVDTWYYIEVFFQRADSGSYQLWVNGTSQGSGTSDFNAAGNANLAVRVWASSCYVDDIYAYSGAAASDRLSSGQTAPFVEVIGNYQNSVEDATDQGDTLESGTVWSNVGQTPWSGQTASYISNPRSGYTITDEGDRPGPVNDTRYTYGTLKAAIWWGKFYRGGGGATTHSMLYGNSSGGNASQTIVLTTSNQPFWQFSQLFDSSAGAAPTTGQSFTHGMSASGGQDIHCTGLLASLLQVRSGPTTVEIDAALKKVTSSVNVSQAAGNVVEIDSTLAKLLASVNILHIPPSTVEIDTILTKLQASLNLAQIAYIEVDTALIKTAANILLYMRPDLTIQSVLSKVIGSLSLVQRQDLTITSTLAKVQSLINLEQRYLLSMSPVIRKVESSINVVEVPIVTVNSILKPVQSLINLTQTGITPQLTINSTTRPTQSLINLAQVDLITIASILAKTTALVNLSSGTNINIASTLVKTRSTINLSQIGYLTLTSVLAKTTASINLSQYDLLTISAILAKARSTVNLLQSDLLSIDSSLTPVAANVNLSQVYLTTIQSVLTDLTASLSLYMRPDLTIQSSLANLTALLPLIQRYDLTLTSLLAETSADIHITQTLAYANIEFVGFAQNAEPAGTIAGDVIIAGVFGPTGVQSNPGSGWTQIGTQRDNGSYCSSTWYIVRGASTPDLTWQGGGALQVNFASYRNVDTTQPIDDNADAASYISPSVNASIASDWLVSLYLDLTITSSFPAGMTARSGAAFYMQFADEALAATGATGTRTWGVPTGGDNPLGVWSVLLRPKTTAPPTVTIASTLVKTRSTVNLTFIHLVTVLTTLVKVSANVNLVSRDLLTISSTISKVLSLIYALGQPQVNIDSTLSPVTIAMMIRGGVLTGMSPDAIVSSLLQIPSGHVSSFNPDPGHISSTYIDPGYLRRPPQ